MQRPDEAKRREILSVATRLFAAHPYHEVRLDDIAAAARVGKGTLYTYFDSKDALYLSLIRQGFADIVKSLRDQLSPPNNDAWQRLDAVAAALVDFAFSFPDLYRVMRGNIAAPQDPELQSARRELTGMIENAIRDGAAQGQVDDPHPELTAQFLLSFVRGALLYPPPGLTPAILRGHINRILRGGIRKQGAA